MSDPLTDAANAISTTSPNVRKFAQLAAQRIEALEAKVAAMQPPAPTGTGIGLLRYGGNLAGTPHLTDGTYELVVASWSDRPTLATCSGTSFAYQALPGAGAYNPMNLADPTGSANMVVSGLKQYPGVDGVFVDNVNGSNSAQILSFLAAFSPVVANAGLKIMLNANGYGYQANGDNDGTGDAAWFAQVGRYATHLMSEYWQQGRGGPRFLYLRHSGSATYTDFWDGWQKLPAAAHAAGCAFCGLTVGRTATKDSDMIYGRASLLTAPGFRAGDVFFGGGDIANDYTADPYDSVWTARPSRPSVDPVAGTASL